MYAVASVGGVHLGVPTWAVGDGRDGSALGEGAWDHMGPVFWRGAVAEGGRGTAGPGVGDRAAPRPGGLPAPPPCSSDMLLLKKQTEDISSVYEIREKLGS